MTAKLLDGKAAAAAWEAELAAKLKTFSSKPKLALVRVGDDPASGIYVRKKIEMCAKLGIESELIHLPASTAADQLDSRIISLNADKTVSGILVQVPLPRQIDAFAVQKAIHPFKDVDGFGPKSMGYLLMGRPRFAATIGHRADGAPTACEPLVAATPAGIMRLLEHYKLDVAGKHCVVVGRSNIVGKPLAILLLQADATVTIAHSKTKHLAAITKQADFLFVAAGQANLVKKDMVKRGVVVVDVGMNRNRMGKSCGDVDFASVSSVASFITPVPGGVGPMTIISLMANTIHAYEMQHSN